MYSNDNTARRIPLPTFSLNHGQHRNAGIIVSNTDFIEILDPREIMYVKAESNYCTFQLRSGEKHMASKTLGNYQELLERYSFIRPHQSFMVNPIFLKRIRKLPAYTLCMTDGIEIPIAKARRTQILDTLLRS